jgi:hypothetical protein
MAVTAPTSLSRVRNFVMAGLVPAIHVFRLYRQDVDARVKPAHDVVVRLCRNHERG